MIPDPGSRTPAGDPLIDATTRRRLEEALSGYRAAGETVALVPTMGSLHEGHLALVDRARAGADRVVLSIFVNPLQFGEGEDLDRYPTDLERDRALAQARGVDLLFAPSVDEMYPGGAPVVRVVPGRMGDRLCGRERPTHFQGVLTVVARLFGLVRPQLAVFGRKDLQQAVLIRRMVEDLALGVQVEIGPLVREHDGLALSSRNVYLSALEREFASRFFETLDGAEADFRAGCDDVDGLTSAVRDRLERGGGFQLEYVEVVDPSTLDRVPEARPGHVLVAAARLGRTRLIDNVVLGAPDPDPRIPPPDRTRRA